MDRDTIMGSIRCHVLLPGRLGVKDIGGDAKVLYDVTEPQKAGHLG